MLFRSAPEFPENPAAPADRSGPPLRLGQSLPGHRLHRLVRWLPVLLQDRESPAGPADLQDLWGPAVPADPVGLRSLPDPWDPEDLWDPDILSDRSDPGTLSDPSGRSDPDSICCSAVPDTHKNYHHNFFGKNPYSFVSLFNCFHYIEYADFSIAFLFHITKIFFIFPVFSSIWLIFPRHFMTFICFFLLPHSIITHA